MKPADMADVYDELRTTPQLRGIKVILLWGRYEKKNLNTGAITYDFSQIDGILNELSKMDNKHLILGFSWREFKGANVDLDILPNDLRGGTLWSDTDGNGLNWTHMKYDHLWAYDMSKSTTAAYGYNLKLWETPLLDRVEAFLKALAEHVDGHPNFNQISTTESATGDPIPGEDPLGAPYDGQRAILRMMRKYFVKTMLVPDLNFTRQYVADVAAILEAEGIGLGSSNSNFERAITTTDPPPGVLTYYPKLSGKVVLAPEIQGKDFDLAFSSGMPKSAVNEFLYLRVRDDLKANYTVIQRNNPYWLGDATHASMLEFIRNFSLITGDPTGAGGLNSARPASVPALDPAPSPTLFPPSGLGVK